MSPLVVDASVWVAAADPGDAFHETSRAFLRRAVAHNRQMILPAFARLEIACALARRLRDVARARALALAVVDAPLVQEQALDPGFLEEAFQCGTQDFLRAADALYAACARRVGGTLMTWDDELLRRAGGLGVCRTNNPCLGLSTRGIAPSPCPMGSIM
ncbi:MAG: type II toxin-antitoxin system VapC family toxin [Acidobacteria bacterium]|nr:type II toxin-antitoxin system VapC family toxin [Acidobacteriota bacterium]